MKKLFPPKTSLLFVSPWLSAAAIGILTMIIVIFAADNIRREKGLMTDSLFRKGQSLVRFVEAGMRASLMSNMQAMKNGGSLTVTVDSSPSDKTITLKIIDTGTGIPPEQLERIMDPYFTTKPEGTGLGLAMAYKIIDEHQGSLQFSSQPGHGTQATIILPKD